MSTDNPKAPPGDDEPIFDEPEGAGDATVMATIPQALLAELAEAEAAAPPRQPAPPPAAPSRPGGGGGLKKMFSRDPEPVRHALPTETEGDALLDMLFDDAKKGAATPPAPAAKPAAAPPPRPAGPPPRPATPAPPAATPRPAPHAPVADEPTPDEPVANEPATRMMASPLRGEMQTLDAESPRSEPTPHPPAAPSPTPGPSELTEPAGFGTFDHAEGSEPSEPLESAPASSHPPPMPSRPPPASAFSNERDASAHLVDAQQRDAWAERAAWLREEAEAIDDRAARARGLLVVSELYVMAGEEPLAKTVATEARDLAPSSALGHRQVRGLLARDADWSAVLEAVDAETRVMTTPAARAHGSLLGAEIARLATSDAEGAKKRVDQAMRAYPGDPRAHVQRLAEQLATVEDAGALAKNKLPEGDELGALAAAWAQVLAHRGVVTKGREAATPYESFLRARSALRATDAGGAVSALEALRRTAVLAGGAGWLGAALAAARKETRPRSVEALLEVVGGSHGAAARRALAARAIELGDAAAARAATEADSSAFTPADRVTLAALTGAPASEVETWIHATLNDPELAAVAAAATAALTAPDAADRRVVHLGEDRARSAAALGRSLAQVATAEATTAQAALESLGQAVAAHAEYAGEAGPAKALLLELDVEAGAGAKVATAVAQWREGEDGSRDVALASALIAEVAGALDAAADGYDRARALDPACEAAVRARAAHADAAMTARMVADHAQAVDGSSRGAVLFAEAALRLGEGADQETSERLLNRSAELDPKLPYAVQLGERAARARGDREGLIEWLRVRREASGDAIEQAHDLVREALLLSDSDGSAAAGLLEQALRARPGDVGLRELFERLSPERPADAASWRAEQAGHAEGVEAARLALEAALELERNGEAERAAVCAKRAVAAGDEQLAPIAVYRAALAGHGAGDLVDALLPRARETTDAGERLEIYERLAELDELGRSDPASGLLWRRSILDETPGHLPTLRRVASTLIAAGRDEELEAVALEIAKATTGAESVAHATLSARLRVKTASWDETLEPVEIAYKTQPRGIWALRQMAAHARAKGNFALAVEVDKQLAERTDRQSEIATISLRAAQAAARGGDLEGAKALLLQAIEQIPTHLLLHLEIASVLEQAGDFAAAANSLEEAAESSVLPDERKLSFYRAAILWLDKAHDPTRGRAALESVAALDPAFEDVFQRLQAIYVSQGARAELADLLARRLDNVTDPGERVEMEVLRGRALADVGDAEAAKRALAAALDASPDHVEALSAFADLCAAEEDWSGAEQAWIRLARLVPEPVKQAGIYMRLGELYDTHLPNPERAELAYSEILKRSPSDEGARERLVGLYSRAGDVTRALEQQTILISAAEAPELKCKRTVELASVFEAANDAKKAEATLLQARKTWPKDDVALGALAGFYQRTGQNPAAQVLLERAVADARRALGTGRFEPYLFATVATVAELRGRPDASRIAHATVAALEGDPAEVDGAGHNAGNPALDELLAPEVMTPAFRELLLKTGPLLDQASPLDLGSLRATPLPPQQAELGDQIQGLARSYGLPGVQIQISSVLGSTAVAAASHPPTLVLGQALVASPREDVRAFLVHRALKVIQTNTGAFSRTAPIDLWPLLAAFLKAFSPNFAPQGVDAAKLTDAYARVKRAAPPNIDPQMGLLAADVIGSIGNRASTLNTAVNGWGARAGLLAVGDPNVALTGVAWAGGHTNQPPPSGKDRVTWIGRNAEARELIVFSVSDAYADARSRLGLGR